MKAYGLPRVLDREFPDKADESRFAVKGHRSFDKKGTRRIFKKLERRASKETIRNYVNEVA